MKFSNADFAQLQRKLSKAGYLTQGYVGKGSDWKFDFSAGREFTLLGVKKFLQDVGPESLSKKDLVLLAFMLDHTNTQGECSGADE